MKKTVFAAFAALVLAFMLMPGLAGADETPPGDAPQVSEPVAAEPTAAVCGGLAGGTCQSGEFCEIADGSCGAADQTGMCEAVPEVCTEEYVPVCGCNGLTYPNDCSRKRAGTAKVKDGTCSG